MKTVYIDTKKIKGIQEMHDILQEKLKFPDYYGGNLDALYDMLTSLQEPVEIYIQDYQNKEDYHFKRYMQRFLRVLQDVEMENDRITVIVEKTGVA